MPAPEEIPPEEPDRKEYNAPQVVVLSQEAFEAGKIPKCFDPSSFKRETLSEKLEKANKGSKQWVDTEKKWSQDETETLLKSLSECSESNYDPMFKKLPARTPEEIILHFMNLPFEQITSLNIFGGKKNTKAGTLTIDQREAIDTMIAQDSNALDDYNSPIIQHAAAFKILLDKVKYEKSLENDKNAFKHERSEEVDSVINQIADITDEHKDTILELEGCLKDNALLLKQKTEDKIKTLLKVLIELQLSKIEQKVTFLDEYEKFMFHELKLLELSRNQLKVERIKQEKEIKGL